MTHNADEELDGLGDVLDELDTIVAAAHGLAMSLRAFDAAVAARTHDPTNRIAARRAVDGYVAAFLKASDVPSESIARWADPNDDDRPWADEMLRRVRIAAGK